MLGGLRQVEDRFHQGFTVFGLHKHASAGFFDNLSSLPVDSDDDWPRARHVFEKFGGNHRFEQLGLPQHDQAEIGSRNIGRNPLPRLLAKKLNVGESASGGEFHDPFLFRPFANQ